MRINQSILNLNSFWLNFGFLFYGYLSKCDNSTVANMFMSLKKKRSIQYLDQSIRKPLT